VQSWIEVRQKVRLAHRKKRIPKSTLVEPEAANHLPEPQEEPRMRGPRAERAETRTLKRHVETDEPVLRDREQIDVSDGGYDHRER
jgi:hypothetical protein